MSALDAPLDSLAAPSLNLLIALRANDQQAWRQLVWLYRPLVCHWCRQARLRSEDAADICQEVFRSVAQAISSFHGDQPGDTLRGWLWTITRNKVRDHFRRQKGWPQAAGGTTAQERLAQVPHEITPASSLTQSPDERDDSLARAVEVVQGEFEERTWQAFWRVTVHDESPSDVAADLRMTPNAVRKAKSRVLSRLRSELGDRPPGRVRASSGANRT
jgi:RNA polymerase sigma-70 factor (ECF subfamily)